MLYSNGWGCSLHSQLSISISVYCILLLEMLQSIVISTNTIQEAKRISIRGTFNLLPQGIKKMSHSTSFKTYLKNFNNWTLQPYTRLECRAVPKMMPPLLIPILPCQLSEKFATYLSLLGPAAVEKQKKQLDRQSDAQTFIHRVIIKTILSNNEDGLGTGSRWSKSGKEIIKELFKHNWFRQYKY